MFLVGEEESWAMDAIQKISPVSGEKIGEFTVGTNTDVQNAAKRAREAFHTWRDVPLKQRLRILDGLREVVHERADFLETRIRDK
jgi:acyl-CoA reductase-like NAD-dependent aldehyde dehydrogenase